MIRAAASSCLRCRLVIGGDSFSASTAAVLIRRRAHQHSRSPPPSLLTTTVRRSAMTTARISCKEQPVVLQSQRVNGAPNITVRLISSAKRKKKDKQKRRRSNNKGRNKTTQPYKHRRRGPNGRLVMTTERLKEPFIQALNLTPHTAKNMIAQAKDKMMLALVTSHVAEGPSHDELFYATSTLTVPSHVTLDRTPDDATAFVGGAVKLTSTGAARRKKHAEFLAAVDLILHLAECGIDVRNLPDLKAKMKAEKQQQFKQSVQSAQMLLELCNASRPRFDTDIGRNRNSFVSEVSLHCQGIPLWATGNPGRSKAEAEGNALIAAAQSAELRELVGRRRLETYRALIQDSPAEHVAALHVPPLPLEALEILNKTIGSHHDSRMEQHAKVKARFEERFRARGKNNKSSSSKRKGKLPLNNDQLNQAFLEEEKGRMKRALDDPEGKQAAMNAIRDALPIKAIQNDLVETLRSEQVVVVSGGTGSGKSTQCPQYILQDGIANGKGAETRIVVTQPRRIAAISVAERIADERDEQIGNSVGYTVRFNRQTPRESGGSIEFVTTGVLLRRLVNDPELEGVSHVMIDEVHEQDLDTDFLLILLRDLLATRPDLRVILMSATLDAEKFAVYFSQQGKGPVPMMSVPAKPRHPVEIIHLEDLAGESTEGTSTDTGMLPLDLQRVAKSLLALHDQQLRLEMEEADVEEKAAAKLEARSLAEDEGKILDESDSDSDSDDEEERENCRMPMVPLSRAETLRNALSTRTAATRSSNAGSPRNQRADKREIGEITVPLIARVAQYIARIETDAGRKGSILCFLPGWDEISEARALLEDSDPSLKSKMVVLPLHSTIPHDDQQKVFEPAANGTVKVILATNIAESSVTIDDVLVVIDCGLVREINFDAVSGMSTMETVPTSKASATQRLGRAGRVAPGKCYRLYSRGAMLAMFERPTPEIQRTALEATCLQTCSMTSESVSTFLQRAMDPPREESVAFAMDRLVKLGAISVNPVDGSEALSPLGRCLSRLPLDPATGRMLIMGCVMQCLDPVLTAAACFGSRDLFYTPLGMRDEQKRVRQSFCATSDLMATVRAYDEFQYLIMSEGWTTAKQWASENFVSIAAINTIRSVRTQLLNELNRIGLVHNSDLLNTRSKVKHLRSDASVNENAGVESLYGAVWAAGLPSNLAARRQLGSFGTLRTRLENHAGLHPSSVAFHRMPPKHRTQRATLPPWFMYREMILTSQVFLRNCTAIRPQQIVLFGGYKLDQVNNVDFRNHEQMADEYGLDGNGHTVVRVLDDWIVLEGSCHDTIDLLSCARREIEMALNVKVMEPRKPLPKVTQSIVDAVCDVYEILDEQD